MGWYQNMTLVDTRIRSWYRFHQCLEVLVPIPTLGICARLDQATKELLLNTKLNNDANVYITAPTVIKKLISTFDETLQWQT